MNLLLIIPGNLKIDNLNVAEIKTDTISSIPFEQYLTKSTNQTITAEVFLGNIDANNINVGLINDMDIVNEAVILNRNQSKVYGAYSIQPHS